MTKTNILAAGLVLALLPTAVVLAQDVTWLNTITGEGYDLVDRLTQLLVALALVFFLWGATVFVLRADNELARAEGRRRMVWGIIALFVIVSVWGLVQLLQAIVGANNPIDVAAPRATVPSL